MAEYLVARKSQIHLFKNIPLYCQSKNNVFVLYKKSGEILEQVRLKESNHPELFIKVEDKSIALKELFSNLNDDLAQQTLSENFQNIRATLHLIVYETIENVNAAAFDSTPETIDILFGAYSKRPELLESLEKLKTASNNVTEHTINVLILAFRYCFFHCFSEQETKRIALCALFHDIGASEVEKSILNSDKKLTDEEYEAYTTHTSKGCDLLLKQKSFDPLVATVAQEHHERIDGSGYPYGRINICFESQLVGLIDHYELLTYRNETHPKALKPFDSFQRIKEEVLHGTFQKELYKNFCSSMAEKCAPHFI